MSSASLFTVLGPDETSFFPSLLNIRYRGVLLSVLPGCPSVRRRGGQLTPAICPNVPRCFVAALRSSDYFGSNNFAESSNALTNFILLQARVAKHQARP